jgi:4-hydroxythreonine-4-phosphate dehydrogenase
MANEKDVIVCDAENDEDLQAIANAAKVLSQRTVWAWAAGLACYLLPAVGLARAPKAIHDACELARSYVPALFVVGSLADTSREQARALAAAPDMLTLTIPRSALLSSEQSSAWREYGRLICERLKCSQDVLVLLDSPDTCASRQDQFVPRSWARMIRPCAHYAGTLVATGGETARAIMEAWGIRRLRLLGEVEPGLPYAITDGWSRQILILTKAGGFGSPDTLLRCRDFLQMFGGRADDRTTQRSLVDHQKS